MLPGVQVVRRLSLDLNESGLEVECVTRQGIPLHVKGVVIFKVGDDHASIANAARRFLDQQAQMSVRTFSRRFKAETGQSPGTWLLQQRVRHACHLLETTDLSVDRVADEAGLGTAASLRHHLRSELGVSPLAYRKTFRAG